MKLKKKTAMITSFAIGTLLFATTALADIATKSGYEELKDSLKVTAEKASEDFDSYTMDFTFVVKDNGKTMLNENESSKHDRINKVTEGTTNRETTYGQDYSSYYYSDSKMDIRKHGGDENYYVTEFTEERDMNNRFTNPFDEDEAEDVERIADAIVGSLKDHVIVNENPDGSKELSGSLSEVQIPTLVNAVASLQAKQIFNGREMTHLTKDIFVKEVTGKAEVNADGVLESVLGTATLSGKDDKGQVHEISFEILAKLTDVNSTTITKPDLTGDKVVKETVQEGKPYSNQIKNPEKFIGKFSNDILIEKDGRFAKIGERFVEITSINSEMVSGRYYEEYREGFEEYEANKNEYTFSGKFENDPRHSNIDITDSSGNIIRGSIFIDEHVGKVNFHRDQPSYGNLNYDYSFSPVLD